MAYVNAEEDLDGPNGFRATFRRTIKDRGVFRYLANRKGKEKDHGYLYDEQSQVSIIVVVIVPLHSC